MTVDETWCENDGLVNTLSARVPSGAPWKAMDKNSIRPGLWNVFPTVDGDHMWPQEASFTVTTSGAFTSIC